MPASFGPAVGGDDALAEERVLQPLVAHVVVEHLGDRGAEDDVEHRLLAAEQLLDLRARRRLAHPRVARAGAQLAADLVEEVLIGPVALDVLGDDAEVAKVALGALVVEPLAEGRAVLERDPQVGVGDEALKAAAAQVELGDHELVEQADDVGARADDEALVGERALERAGAAQALAALEHEHRAAGAREVGRGGQAVVAAADDDGVPLARGELGQRLGEPDLAEPGCDLVHAAVLRSGSWAIGERVDGDGAAGVDEHGVELEQLEALVEQQRARARGERGGGRDVDRGAGARARQQRRGAQRAQRALDARGVGGQRDDGDVAEGLGPDAAQPDGEYGHDGVAARADQQLDRRAAPSPRRAPARRRRDVAVAVAHEVAIGPAHVALVLEPQRHRAGLGLVAQPGGDELERDRAPEPREDLGRVVLVARRCAPAGRGCPRRPAAPWRSPRRATARALVAPAARRPRRSRAGARRRRAARRSAAAQASAVRRPATAATSAPASSHAASSSSSSGRVEATSVGTGLAAAPARIPSRTASQLSRTAPSSPCGLVVEARARGRCPGPRRRRRSCRAASRPRPR